MKSPERWERAKMFVLLALFVAAVPNTIEAFASPGGDAWTILRTALSAVFVLALLYWLYALAAYRPRRAGTTAK